MKLVFFRTCGCPNTRDFYEEIGQPFVQNDSSRGWTKKIHQLYYLLFITFNSVSLLFITVYWQKHWQSCFAPSYEQAGFSCYFKSTVSALAQFQKRAKLVLVRKLHKIADLSCSLCQMAREDNVQELGRMGCALSKLKYFSVLNISATRYWLKQPNHTHGKQCVRRREKTLL